MESYRGRLKRVAADALLHLAVHGEFPGAAPRDTGYVLVLDDLTEVLRAQKSAAWQEVAPANRS